jgi:hypothetical protein
MNHEQPGSDVHFSVLQKEPVKFGKKLLVPQLICSISNQDDDHWAIPVIIRKPAPQDWRLKTEATLDQFMEVACVSILIISLDYGPCGRFQLYETCPDTGVKMDHGGLVFYDEEAMVWLPYDPSWVT